MVQRNLKIRLTYYGFSACLTEGKNGNYTRESRFHGLFLANRNSGRRHAESIVFSYTLTMPSPKGRGLSYRFGIYSRAEFGDGARPAKLGERAAEGLSQAGAGSGDDDCRRAQSARYGHDARHCRDSIGRQATGLEAGNGIVGRYGEGADQRYTVPP